MNAIHINRTKPYINKFGTSYQIEDFEILTTILSALKWQEKNGSIKMVTDSIGADYYESIGLLELWDMGISKSLDHMPKIDENLFWAAGKLFALNEETAPTAVIDTDFIVWESILFDKLPDVSVIHREDLYPDIYPDINFFNMNDYTFDPSFNWDVRACNTAFCVFKNNNFMKYYTSESINFMLHADDNSNDTLKYMVFAEQRLLAMCAEKYGVEILEFSNLFNLFRNGEGYFTHIWGMKQQMRDIPALRFDFCKRCISRIEKDFPHWIEKLRKIDCLRLYFQ